MREVPVELDEESVEQLEVERDLLGFETLSEYVRWIVENRAAIDQGTERERLLSAYADRIEALERRLDRLESLESDGSAEAGTGAEAGGDVGAGAGTDAGARAGAGAGGPPDGDAQATAGRDGDAQATTGSGDGHVTAGTGDGQATPGAGRDEHRTAGVDPAEADGVDSTVVPDGDAVAADDGLGADSTRPVDSSGSEGGRDGPDPSDERDDDPGGAGSTGSAPTESTARERPGSTSADSPGSTPESAEEAGVTSMHLAPERVSRISGDPVSKDADVLRGVETERLDELTRRAVAKTREKLDRDVETGLSYRSNTTLADSEVRPGDDIADLDALDLPGRSEETLERRREVAGRALALLRDRGEARRSDFVDELYESHPAGYDTESGWWNCIKAALKQVEAVDGGEGRRVWRYVG